MIDTTNFMLNCVCLCLEFSVSFSFDGLDGICVMIVTVCCFFFVIYALLCVVLVQILSIESQHAGSRYYASYIQSQEFADVIHQHNPTLVQCQPPCVTFDTIVI